MESNIKIQLVLASTQFLYRLGIKTMLSIIDVDPEIVEVDSLTELIAFQESSQKSHYVIVSNDLLSYPKQSCLEQLKLCGSKIMVIGDDVKCTCEGVIRISNIDSQKVILDKFHELFFEPKLNSEDAASSMLSEREVEVLKAVALGFSNKEIAVKLFISINTVVTHRKNVTEKLGIKTIAGLTVYALMNNLISPEDVQI